MIGRREPVKAFERDLEEGGDHDDGEDEHANGFESSSADGIRVTVLAGDELGRGPDNGRAEEVEGCVNQGCQHGKGAGKHDHGDFPCEQDRVSGKVDV